MNFIPLPSRIRPQKLNEFIGQTHLIGKGKPITKLIKSDNLMSMILWGPPGSGKTTLVRIMANETKSKFIQISAVDSGKEDLRKVISQAKQDEGNKQNSLLDHYKGTSKNTILFIDEIHRFNKAQQDYLLPFVEDGTIILIGATTENPSFEVISPLLSRCRVFILKSHSINNLKKIIISALKNKNGLGNVNIDEETINYLANSSNGDPRTALNALELATRLSDSKKNIKLNKFIIQKALQHKALLYDKHGEEHFNLISALHKSMRSSDVNASIYWTARMLEAGEDPLYIARRMLRFASEDVGNADPQALVLANAVFDACKKIGMPECNVFLSQLAIYLAKAPKDNSAYIAYGKAKKDAYDTLNLPVPLHLRNAPTQLMKHIGYGKSYIYDHDLPSKKSGQQCMPDKLKDKKYV